MITITEKNRSLAFLGGTLIIGLIILGVIMLSETVDVKRGEKVVTPPPTNLSALENKINNLKNQPFDPSSYSTLITEIEDSYKQTLITSAVRSNLEASLKNVYSDLVYAKSEAFLTGSDINSSTEIQGWLNQVETISSRNAKIENYRTQIYHYNYYISKFPNEVMAFVSPGIGNYQDDSYRFLKDKAKNMPGLAETYRNSNKLQGISKKLIDQLESFNAEWATAGQNEQPEQKEL